MSWEQGFIDKIIGILDNKKPRKVYMRGKVKNYYVGGLSITIDEMFGEVWIYDLENERPLLPGDEIYVLKRLET